MAHCKKFLLETTKTGNIYFSCKSQKIVEPIGYPIKLPSQLYFDIEERKNSGLDWYQIFNEYLKYSLRKLVKHALPKSNSVKSL